MTKEDISTAIKINKIADNIATYIIIKLYWNHFNITSIDINDLKVDVFMSEKNTNYFDNFSFPAELLLSETWEVDVDNLIITKFKK